MIEQMKRDVELVDELLASGASFPSQRDAWQRLKASLSPDRDGLAEAMYEAQRGEDSHWRELTPVQRVWWLAMADGAIEYMQGVKP